MGGPSVRFTDLPEDVQAQAAKVWAEHMMEHGEAVITGLNMENRTSKIGFVNPDYALQVLRSMNHIYTASGQRLFKFSDLTLEVQQGIAEQLAALALSVEGNNFATWDEACEDAHKSLLTEPDHKYLADGQEG